MPLQKLVSSFAFSDFQSLRSRHFIAHRARFAVGLYVAFFLVLLFTTSLFSANPESGHFVGSAFAVVVAITLELSRRLFHNENVSTVMSICFYVLQFTLGLSWGLLSAYVMTKFSVGWVFFVVLLTCFILSSVHSFVYVSDIRFHGLYQFALLGPSIYVAFVLVGGQVGSTIGGFAASYLAFMLLTGYALYRQFWRTVNNQQKVESIVSSTPALLCWLDSDLKIHGVSQSFSDFFKKPIGEIKGLSLAQLNCDPLVAFASEFISKGKSNDSASRIMNLGARQLYFRAKQYIPGEEMVLVGLDVTDQNIVQEELEMKREQIVNSARFVSKGILLETLSRYFERFNGSDPEVSELEKQKLDEMSLALRNLTHRADQSEYIVLEEALRPIELFFESEAIETKSVFIVDYDEIGAKCKGNLGDLTLAVFNIVRNGFDAIRDSEIKLVRIISEVEGEEIIVSVHDTGVGVDEVFDQVIFEPTFTTKGGAHLGTGLSLAREIILECKGTIKYIKTPEGTCFEIRLPLFRPEN